MSKTKRKIKIKSETKISIFGSSTIKKAYSNFKKTQEQKKIKEIKLKKLAENNQLFKDRK